MLENGSEDEHNKIFFKSSAALGIDPGSPGSDLKMLSL